MVLGIGEIGRVWTHENKISSDRNTNEVPLFGLPAGALELFGELAKIDGKTKLNGIFAHDPFQAGRDVTADGFDQVQLFHAISGVQLKLMSLGIDIKGLLGGQHGGKTHPIVAHANAVPDLNAWYSPQREDLTFGTNGEMQKKQDKWHLASDSDVSVHETGHLLLDHINKKLGTWMADCRNNGTCAPEDLEQPEGQWARSEGRAIHEGFADALAALYYDDPEMSEDFAPNIGKPESKADGLRILNNDLTLDNVGWEEHDRGQVYAAFFWSIKKALSDPFGPFKMDSRQAADMTLLILFNHASNYTSSKPTSKDFVDAVLRGIDGMAIECPIPADLQMIKEAVIAEATKRKMLKPQPAPKPDEDPLARMRIKDIKHLENLAGKNVSFKPEQTSRFYGGSQEIYQQQYQTAKFGAIDIVGGSVFINKDKKGRVVNISARDMRNLSSSKINEDIKVAPGKAQAIALDSAQKQLLRSNMKLQNFKAAPPRSKNSKELLHHIKEAQMDVRVAEMALKNLDSRFNISPPKPKLVILPDSNDLFYEIKVGLGIYYVNASSGTAKFVRDVIVN